MKKDADNYGLKQTVMPMVALFGSMGTLVCCALPALLVTLGAGATLAGIVSQAPWLVALSKYKVWTFGISGLMLIIAGWLMFRARNMPCPTDEQQAKLCARLRRFSWVVYSVSVILWLIGFFFAFVAVHIFY